MKYFTCFVVILSLLACEEINSSLDNPYDSQSPLYSGNIPVITNMDIVNNNLLPESMYCNTFVRISWKDSSSNISNYIINRSKDGQNYVRIGNVDGNTFSFVDSSFDLTAHRYYTIQSQTDKNVSPPSSPISINLTCYLKPLYQVQGINNCVEASFSSHKDGIALIGDNSKILEVIDFSTGAVRFTTDKVYSKSHFIGYTYRTAVSFTSDGKSLVYSAYPESHNNDDYIYLFFIDSQTGVVQKEINVEREEAIVKIMLSNDNSRAYTQFQEFYATGNSGYACIDLNKEMTIRSSKTADNIDLSRDNKSIVYGEGDFWYIKDISSWETIHKIERREGATPRAIFDYYDSRLLTFGDESYYYSGLYVVNYLTGSRSSIKVSYDGWGYYGYVMTPPEYSYDGQFLFCRRGDDETGYLKVYIVNTTDDQHGFQELVVNKKIDDYSMAFYPDNSGYLLTLSDAKLYEIHFTWEVKN